MLSASSRSRWESRCWPIGYQTNLMVYGPGGYRFTDYVRLGLPLSLVVGTAVLLAIPWFWPF